MAQKAKPHSLRLSSVNTFQRCTRAVLESNGHPAPADGESRGSTSRGLPGLHATGTGGLKTEPKLMSKFDEDNAALDKIEELGIAASLYEHVAAFTVEEQAAALGSLSGVKTKNLFFKVLEGVN